MVGPWPPAAGPPPQLAPSTERARDMPIRHPVPNCGGWGQRGAGGGGQAKGWAGEAGRGAHQEVVLHGENVVGGAVALGHDAQASAPPLCSPAARRARPTGLGGEPKRWHGEKCGGEVIFVCGRPIRRAPKQGRKHSNSTTQAQHLLRQQDRVGRLPLGLGSCPCRVDTKTGVQGGLAPGENHAPACEQPVVTQGALGRRMSCGGAAQARRVGRRGAVVPPAPAAKPRRRSHTPPAFPCLPQPSYTAPATLPYTQAWSKAQQEPPCRCPTACRPRGASAAGAPQRCCLCPSLAGPDLQAVFEVTMEP